METKGSCRTCGTLGTISENARVHVWEESAVVKLTRLVGDCDEDECPTLYANDRGTLVVQGGLLTDHGREIPPHEALVEVPFELIRKAVRGNLV
ncbi:hypothetical protein ACFY2H_27680 [Streptomyces griseofuscus]|jgi:hypothetical protein|uniref:Uncharacterized protein n=1 Tax=Streptomyces griseofuscus TaxID=146922 RepID=A0A7H1Q261_9ACTN|nr:hypothetical protein HEP81_04112 [Streptomyces griseofuscus]